MDVAYPAISSEFYAEVLNAATGLPQTQRHRAICQLILQHAIKHLDLCQRGMLIVIVRCMPPLNGRMIRSLRVSTAIGTLPWSEQSTQLNPFLGAESLSGYVTATGHSALIQDIACDKSRLPVQPVEHMASVMVSPLKHADRTAGCLWVASQEVNTFTQPLATLIQQYASLITVAFETEDFYLPQDFELCVMPPLLEQIPVLVGIRERIMHILSRAGAQPQSLSYRDAELLAWQEVEEELIRQLVLT